MDRNEILHVPRHLVVPSGESKMISEPTVRSAQTVHLSWIKICTISKWTKTSFHLSLVTKECHLVHPKWFLSLWYVWRKPCTYLAPKLTLPPKRPKRDSTWPTSPRSSVRCIQNDIQANCIKISTISNRTETSFHLSLVTKEYHRVRAKWFLRLWYV
jgi:hypothetical protein